MARPVLQRMRLALVDRLARLWAGTVHGLELGHGVRFYGLPMLDIAPGAQVIVEDGALLDSRNFGYHLNMHSPTKLIASRPGAVIRIGQQTRVHGSCLHAGLAITIGQRCLIAANCQIFDGSGHDVCFDDVTQRQQTRGTHRPVVIEDDVWLGANTIVLPGVTLGCGCVVGAGSVVTRDVPPMTLVAGNPATVRRARTAAP